MLEPTQKTAARIVGFLYLFTNVTAIVAFSIRGKLMVLRDPVQSATNIAGSEQLWRIGIATELVTIVGVLILLWGLYVVLRPIHRDVALLAAFLRLGENFTLAFITVLEFAALAAVKGVTRLQAFGADASHALVYTSLRVYGDAFNIGFLFLGLGSAVFSHLWWKSRYIPRLLAGWEIFSSLLMAAMSVAVIIFPALAKLGITYMMPMGLYEFGLGFWLLIKGITVPTAAAVAATPSESR